MAHTTGLKVGVFFQLRHHPGHQKIRDLIRSGAIGEVLVVEAHAGSYGAVSGWRTNPELAGGGVIFDQGVHLYDLVRYVTGAEVTAVSVLDDRPAGQWLDRTTMCMLKMTNEVLAYTCCDHRLAVPKRSLEVRGSSGSIIFDEGTNLSSDKPLQSTLSIASAKDAFDETFVLDDLINRQIENFNRAIIDDHEPNASWTDGLRNAEIVGAIRRATATGALAAVESDTAMDDSRSFQESQKGGR
jgi:predicted dehydrogenase